jgi:hypothetical protein
MDLPPEAVPASQWKPQGLPPEAVPSGDYESHTGVLASELPPAEEQKFQNWLKANPHVPDDPDYDTRGFYKALKKGDPRARATVGPDKRIVLPETWRMPGPPTSKQTRWATPLIGSDVAITPQVQAEATSPAVTALSPEFEKEHPIASAAYDYGAPIAGLALGGKQIIEGGMGARAAESVAERGLGPTAIGDVEAPPPAGPVSIKPAIELKPEMEAPQGPSRPVTPIAEPRPETAIPAPRPETAIPPARPETAIPPSRPETSFAADAVGAVDEVRDDFTEKTLARAGKGQPGLSTRVAAQDEQWIPGTLGATHEITYRAPDGTPVAVINIRPDESGTRYIADFAVDKSKGLLTGRAAKAVAEEAKRYGAVAPYEMSPDAARFTEHAAKAAQTPPPEPPKQVIPEPTVSVQPSETPKAPVTLPEAPKPAPQPLPDTINGVEIEQGDRDFAALVKQGAEKDADLAKFISKPKKADPIIMQARRLYDQSDGEISAVDLGKRLGIPKRVAVTLVKGLDKLSADQEKKLTLTAPPETEATPPAGEEPAEPTQAELEAAGQTSMFGPSPAPPPKPAMTAAAPADLPPEAVPMNKYTPERFAGTEETIGREDPNSRIVPRKDIYVSPEHFQYKVGGNEKGAGLSLMGADEFNYNSAKDLMLWYDEKGEIGPPKRYYVVNGHQRLALATRDNAEYVPGVVLDSGNTLKQSIAQNVTKENARARGAVLNFQQGRGTSIDAATFMRDGGLTEDQIKSTYKDLDLTENNVREAIELSKLDNWLWAEVANHRLKPELGAVIGRELPNNPPAQFSIFKHIDELKAQGKSVTPEHLDDLINAQKIAGHGTVESETKDMFGQKEMRKSLVEEVADLWGKARKAYAEGKLHGTIAKKQEQLEQGSTKIDVATAKSIAAESARLAKEFDTFRKINGSETVKVTREYAAKLAAEPKMKPQIYAKYLKAVRPALDQDKVNFRLKPGEMKIEEPQAELPVK